MSDQLVIGGTVFPHKEIHKFTWTSPNGHTRNQIDHICISRKWRRSMMDVRNRRSATIDSDHELIIGELLIKLSHTVNRTTIRPPSINVQRLSDSNLSTRMATTLREQMTTQPLNHSWEQTCSILRSTAEEMLGTRQRRRTDWISAHTWELISKRNSQKSKADHDCRARDEHKELCKMVKKSARNNKRKFLDRLAENAESAANSNNIRSLYQIISQLTGSCHRRTQPVRDPDGRLLTDDEAQLQRWPSGVTEVLSLYGDQLHRTTEQHAR
ncbi:uncharacterized protein [Drosophila bipectinata]|uniref:uncharacterized protein n=1 Tax=Drosophila bipectinata TaxID=42026 RepID=UPI001C89576C|nr:uncharacterized protein LOC122322086 [Drosophila bipectinata]